MTVIAPLTDTLHCGIPVVQPDSASFAEIVAETGGGVCVPPRDPAALARAWQQLLRDPARRQAFGTAGRFGVEKHFTARTMSEQFRQAVARLKPRERYSPPYRTG